LRFSELVLKFLETTLGPIEGESGGDGASCPPRPRDVGRRVLMLIELPCPWPPGEADA